MKNKREIVESKYPPRNNEDIWLKDLLLYASTTKGWQPLGSEKTYSNKTELLKDTPIGGTIGIDKETGTAYLYNDVSKKWTPIGGGGGGMTETTWQELKDKRDNGQLIPGSLYRITDYNCTTTQENTRSAGHQFDIVLLALSENKLAEEGWAVMHDNIYDVTFNDGVTKKCYLYNRGYDAEYEDKLINVVDVDTLLGGELGLRDFQIDDTTKTAIVDENSSEFESEGFQYNYFQNSNLSAWKVWYCLDNDKSRFAWADDDVPQIMDDEEGLWAIRDASKDDYGMYAWYIDSEDEIRFTKSLTPQFGDPVYSSATTVIGELIHLKGFGRGVIYRLIDEWNIDYPCDFKNMLTLVPMDSDDNIAMQNPISSKYCYVFTDNTSGEPEDLSINGHATNIKVKANLIENTYSAMYFSPTTLFYTNNNKGNTCRFLNITVGISNVTIFINKGYNITILDGSSNVMLKSCSTIYIGYDSSNIVFNTVVRSTFGSNCQNIQLTGENDLNYGNGGVELATKDDLN